MSGVGTRFFLAVEAPAKVLDLSGIEWLDAEYLRKVRSDQRHVTSAFLGNVSRGKIDALVGALSDFSFRKFVVQVKGISAFSDRPRVIFAGVAKGREELEELSARLRDIAKGVGIEVEEREFSPHITIARVRNQSHSRELAERIKEYRDHDFGSFICDSVKLKRSVLMPEGPEYTDIFTVRASH